MASTNSCNPASRPRSPCPVFTATHANHAALRALGTRRIGVVSPFDDAANDNVRASFEEAGFEVAAIGGLACPDISSIAHSKLDEIRRLFH